jgi:NADPH:quinone reductase-like Zn-dependent oxidoreductase
VAATTALQGLRDMGKLQSGQRVLINGAAGGVGTYGVQIAKALGAEVTGVCSTRNVDLVKSIGADEVIDYSQKDFTKGAVRYDVILDNAGNHSLSSVRGVLKTNGTLVYNSGASMGRIAAAQLFSRLGRNVRSFLATTNHEDLLILRDWLESGKLHSVIDRTYPLKETPAAIAYVEGGHVRGKVVITN